MPPRRSTLKPEYRFNEAAGRYIGSSGRFVRQAAVRAALDRGLDNASKNAQALAESLRAGSISLAQWQVQMAREIKSVHVASAALARGGWAQMAPADYGRAGQRIRFHYERLANFASEIASGRQRLDGTLPRRAQLYIQAGRGTYHLTQRVEMERRGMGEERNLRAATDSCPGCLEAEAMGWVPIGILPPVGSRDCASNCRCSVEYRSAAA